MRNKNNRKEVETLYILGAGASYALSYRDSKKSILNRNTTPLDCNFIKCLKETIPKKNNWIKKSTNFISNNWLDNNSEIYNLGLEKAIITRIDDYNHLNSFHKSKKGVSTKAENLRYISHMSHLICNYLKGCKPNQKKLVIKFINHLFPKNTQHKEYNNRVITFNYDTIIDDILIYEYKIPKKIIYFDGIADNKEDGRIRSKKFLHPFILKLHGSINWRCLKEDFDKLISSNDSSKKINIWHSDNIYSPDHDHTPVIIPPIPHKPITKSTIFKFLWERAYEYLSDAKRIVIVGYSFPETDNMARQMFKQFNNDKIEEITIVDTDPTVVAKFKEIINPSMASKIRLIYYPSFEHYIASEC
jgi:hypothetical protein